MKLILLIVVIVGISSAYGYLPESDYGEEFLALAKILHKKCVPITGVTQEMIYELRDGHFSDDERIKRYTLCLWLLSGEMNDDYTLKPELLNKYMPKKVTNGAKIYLRCSKEAHESGIAEPYERVYSMVKCYFNADPENFIMF